MGSICVLARVLNRLEARANEHDASLHRFVIRRLNEEFAAVVPSAALDSVLALYPEAAGIYVRQRSGQTVKKG